MDCPQAAVPACYDGNCPYDTNDKEYTGCADCPYRAKVCMECVHYHTDCPYEDKEE